VRKKKVFLRVGWRIEYQSWPMRINPWWENIMFSQLRTGYSIYSIAKKVLTNY
jgi:hypothetical protein